MHEGRVELNKVDRGALDLLELLAGAEDERPQRRFRGTVVEDHGVGDGFQS